MTITLLLLLGAICALIAHKPSPFLSFLLLIAILVALALQVVGMMNSSIMDIIGQVRR